MKRTETLNQRLDPERHPFLTVTEWVEITGMDRLTILKGIERKEIPALKIGRAWRIPTVWARAQVFPSKTVAGMPA